MGFMFCAAMYLLFGVCLIDDEYILGGLVILAAAFILFTFGLATMGG